MTRKQLEPYSDMLLSCLLYPVDPVNPVKRVFLDGIYRIYRIGLSPALAFIASSLYPVDPVNSVFFRQPLRKFWRDFV